MEHKKKILFIYTSFSSFVKTDFEILSVTYDVKKYSFKPSKGLYKTAMQFIRQFLFLLFNIWKYDAVFIWFADQHSFLPVLFGKVIGINSFVVVGGYDVIKMPELNYGVFTSKIRGYFAVFSMKHSTLNFAVSKNVARRTSWITRKSNTHLIYNCVNIPVKNNLQTKKENLIITVGLIESRRTFLLKGIDTFIKVAESLPEFKFMIIGINKNLIKEFPGNCPANLECIEPVAHEELERYYKRAKIYCQFSRSESFGVSIIEAMNFGCFPIVTNVGGMPEIVKSGGIVTKRNIHEIADIIEKRIENKTHVHWESKRELILKPFLFSTRKKKLLEAIGKIIQK